MSIFALTLSEAAELAAIPKSTLEASIVLGQGPKARRLGKRTVVILREDLENWLRSLPETRLVDGLDGKLAEETHHE